MSLLKKHTTITREECLAIVEEFKPGTEFIDTTKLTGNSLTLKK